MQFGRTDFLQVLYYFGETRSTIRAERITLALAKIACEKNNKVEYWKDIPISADRTKHEEQIEENQTTVIRSEYKLVGCAKYLSWYSLEVVRCR